MLKGFRTTPEVTAPPCLVFVLSHSLSFTHLKSPRVFSPGPANRLPLLEVGYLLRQGSCVWGSPSLPNLPQALPGWESSIPQAQEQFKLSQMGCSEHSYVVKFSFLGGLRIMGNLRSPIAVHLLAWDGTVPKPWDVLYQQGADRSELSMYLRIHLWCII